MNFAFPLAWILAAATPVVVALYLQRPRRRRIDVSSLFFWQRVLDRQPHRRFLGRLRRPLSLLLQLLVLALLVLAAAQPEPGRHAGRQSTVIVIDARARMQAHDGEPFRLASQGARDLALAAGPEREIAVLAVDGAARIVSGFASDPREIQDRIAGLQATDASGGMEETLALANDLLASRPGKHRLVVFTDRPLPEASGSEQVLTGRPGDNAALLTLAQRRLPASPQTVEILTRVANFSRSPQDVEVEFLRDGKAFDVRTFSLVPGEPSAFATTIAAGPDDTALEARLTRPDALAADNTARTVIAGQEPIRVLLLTTGNPFLEGALRADPGVSMELLAPNSWRPEMNRGFDVVIFDRTMPADTSLEGLLPGAYLFIGTTPLDSGLPKTVPSARPNVTSHENALLWNVHLDSVRFFQTAPLQLPEGSAWRTESVMEADGEPILATLEDPDHRVVATGFDLQDTNFALRAGFPLFVSNVVRWLADRTRPDDTTLAAGSTYVPAPGESISREPQGSPAALTANAPSMTEGPVRLKKSGYYEVRTAKGSHALAVNASSAVESDLRAATGAGQWRIFSGGRGGLRWWQWLALAALLALTLEWALHHHRLTE